MAEPNATITMNSPHAQVAANSRARDKNREGELILVADPLGDRKPEFYVGIFNVDTKPFTVQRSWAVGGTVHVSGRDKDALYSPPLVLKDVEKLQKLRPGSDEIQLIPTSGTFLAQDICNCNDPKGDWTTSKALNPATATNEGNNYYEKGLFWVKLETPTSEPDFEAVTAAVERLEKYYQRLVEEGNRLYQSGPKGQEQICQPHHDAAQYFIDAGNTLDLPWHATMRGGLSGRLRKMTQTQK